MQRSGHLSVATAMDITGWDDSSGGVVVQGDVMVSQNAVL